MGILPLTLDKLGIPPEDTLVWLGPAIGPDAFEVHEDVRDLFLSQGMGAAEHFKSFGDRFLCDLYAIARAQCAKRGVVGVYGGGLCTYSDPERFYSYRRDGVTGRMASICYLEAARF
jgi:copper oxidase (laccase) domain-containing protein